ncbi:MAG: polyamine aminopropyltransferase [Desulfobacterales bacterium]|nr:polyamine aminopropyltransferase [Desulfobacterales bacterium]MDJ0801741.1 polyamine aminopropyltransferase [Desulfobacterales bacterium]
MPISSTAAVIPSRTASIILLASVFLVAGCGLVYELVAGAVSSYIMGDAVTQFSLVIGVFLCAMGLGAYAAKFINGDLLRIFVEIEIWVGLVGGISSVAMFAVSALADQLFPVFFYSLCAAIGILIGIEIPLLIRILKSRGSISAALSHVLALDYFGALAGAIVFPLLVLPYLGLSRASLVFGLMNLGVAAAGIALLRERRFGPGLRLAVVFVLLGITLVYSSRLVGFLEDLLYQDSIVYARSTAYQRIVLTRWRDDIRLYLNGNIQFSAIDEARYHEALVLPAMAACPRPASILILGGGDGMAAREVLKFEQVQRIVLVDLDPEMTRLGRERPELVALNQGALKEPRLTVINADAFQYVEDSREFFDVIIVDLPDPNNENLAKLYTTAFYALCAKRLAAAGVMVTQATSPFFAPEAFACILRTIGAAVPATAPSGRLLPRAYHVNVPSFGEWGFIIAGREPVRPQNLVVNVPARFLNTPTLQAMFVFSQDLIPDREVRINRLDEPVLYEYYKRGWGRFHE